MVAPLVQMSSTSCGPDVSGVLGSTEARLWTPPLRELTPETSYGFDVIRFADEVLEEPLDPWQEWAVIHAGELLEDGRPRFRTVLMVVARQNGKTHLLRTLALYWAFVERWPLTLGMSTNLEYAAEAWQAAVDKAQSTPALAELVPANGVRLVNGQQQLRTVDGARYKIAASNRRGGRSLSIDRLVIDELREHHDWSAWAAATPAMNARPYAQAFCITNQGDDRSVVLDSLRDAALRFIDTGEGDSRLGLFEWSAAEDADPSDPRAWAAANPNLGRRIDVDAIAGAARRAVAAGGEELAAFRTEVLCQRVRQLNPAVDPIAWQRCREPGDLSGVRRRVACCLDIAPDGQHGTLVAGAVLADGRVRVEVVEAWDDTDRLRRALPRLLERVKPRVLGWFPAGPAAALTADLRERPGWPPPGVQLEEIRGDVTAVCMGLAEQVAAGRVVHSGDPLLDAHITGAERLRRGDAWVFSRRTGHVDAAYATAGVVHLARLLPPAVGKPRVIVAD